MMWELELNASYVIVSSIRSFVRTLTTLLIVENKLDDYWSKLSIIKFRFFNTCNPDPFQNHRKLRNEKVTRLITELTPRVLKKFSIVEEDSKAVAGVLLDVAADHMLETS